MSSVRERLQAADDLLGVEDEVVDHLTQQCLDQHPGFTEPGAVLRLDLRQEIARLIQFLGGALVSGSPEAFADSFRWTARVLDARGFSTAVLVACLEDLPELLAARLPAHATLLSPAVEAGREAGRRLLAAREQTAPAPLPDAAAAYLQALLAGRRRAALGVVSEELARGRGLMDLYADVIEPAMVEVGRLWETNQITVAQEHMATLATQGVLARLYATRADVAPRRGHVLIAVTEGEHHQIGAHIVADALELDGWDVRFLGEDVPSDSLLRTVLSARVDVLGLSATMLANLASLARVIAAVRRRAGGDRLRIVVGGGAFRPNPQAAAELGSDGLALGVRAAVELLRGMSPG